MMGTHTPKDMDDMTVDELAAHLKSIHEQLGIPAPKQGICSKCGTRGKVLPIGKKNTDLCMQCAWNTPGAGKKAREWAMKNRRMT